MNLREVVLKVGSVGHYVNWRRVICPCAGTDNELEWGGTKNGFGRLDDTATDSSSYVLEDSFN